MGFRKGAYATVWEIEVINTNLVKARIAISHKDKETDKYIQDFGGYITFAGTAAAGKALKLKEKDRIRLGDVDVITKSDKDKEKWYTNFYVYSFESPYELNSQRSEIDAGAVKSGENKIKFSSDGVDSGEINNSGLPF